MTKCSGSNFNPFLQLPVNIQHRLFRQMPIGQDNALVANISLEAANFGLKAMVLQPVFQQVLDQGFRDPVEGDFQAWDCAEYNWLYSAKMKRPSRPGCQVCSMCLGST